MRTRGQLARIRAMMRGDLLDCAGAAVDVGAPQLGAEEMPAAEDVERQVAVAVVVAMEEAALLMPVQWVIGGVEVEDDLPRRCAVRLQEQPHEEILNRFAIERGWLNSSRFKVDLPANGAQSERFASSLPASTAIAGSCRSTSWSLRSS